MSRGEKLLRSAAASAGSPVGVVQAGVALSSQGANLLPVGHQLVFLHVDLGGVLRMRLLQTTCISTQGVHLVDKHSK